MEAILEKIRDFADAAHGEQTRKYTPDRYIVHPVRVMETLRGYDASLPVLAAALLHDVLEDTPVTPDELLEFLNTVMDAGDAEETLHLVIDMTDVYVKAAYRNLNRKQRKKLELERIAKTSPTAQTIKYADILDNIHGISADDPGFAPKYLRECLAILKVADKGDAGLYERVLESVQAQLEEISD